MMIVEARRLVLVALVLMDGAREDETDEVVVVLLYCLGVARDDVEDGSMKKDSDEAVKVSEEGPDPPM